jgi:hypothetical protein
MSATVEIDKTQLKSVIKNIIDLVDDVAYEISGSSLDTEMDTRAIRDKCLTLADEVDKI